MLVGLKVVSFEIPKVVRIYVCRIVVFDFARTRFSILRRNVLCIHGMEIFHAPLCASSLRLYACVHTYPDSSGAETHE